MQLMLLPLLGPLHLISPALNAVTVRDLAATFEPTLLATTAVSDEDLGTDAWQDTPEIALPLAVVPWARAAGLELIGLGPVTLDENAEADFRRYAGEVPALRGKLTPVEAGEARLRAALAQPLTPAGLMDNVLPLVRGIERDLVAVAGDGPANGRRLEGAGRTLEQLLERAAGQRVVLLTGLQELPALEQALEAEGVHWQPFPNRVAVTPAARERSLLDQAMTVDPGRRDALLAALADLDSAEAAYHRANLLLAGGDAPGALGIMERAANSDFSRPYFLPGWLLARLGQLRDLAGRREEALKAYRGVLALSWAPAEALEAATAGLRQPFAPPAP